MLREQKNQTLTQNSHQLSIALVGSMSSGKTSLIQKIETKKQLKENQFKNTIGADLYTRRYSINNQQYVVRIWDTQGFDRNWGINGIPLVKKCNGFIVMFDITSRLSFQNVRQCLLQIFQKCKPQNQHVLLLANKSDKLNKDSKQQIARQQIQALSQQFDNIQYKVISVKSLSSQKLQKIIYQKMKILAAKIISDEEYQKNLSLKGKRIKLNSSSYKKKSKGCVEFISRIKEAIFG